MNREIYKKIRQNLKFFAAAFLIFTLSLPPISLAQENTDKRSVQEKFRQCIKEAKVYYEEKNYQKAIDKWKEALTFQPKNEFVKESIKSTEKRMSKKIEKKPSLKTVKKKSEKLAKTKKKKRTKTKKHARKKKEAKKSPKKSAEKKKEAPPEKRKLDLEECIAIAAENHLPLLIAKKQLKLAEFRLLEAKRKLGPTVTAKWEISGGQVVERYYDGEKITFEGKQPIFYGGELIFSVKQAKINLEVVKTDFGRIKNEMILQVKKAYYSLDKSKKTLKIQSKLYKRTKEFYDIARGGYEAGVVSYIEFLEVNSKYNQINFQVVSAEEDLSVANLLLQQAMNIEEEVEIAEVGEPGITELNLEDCFNLAYLNRPEIKIRRLFFEYFEYEEKIAKARANFPRVDLLGSYGNTREDFLVQDLANRDHPRGLGPEYYVGTKISLPLWGSTLGYSYTQEDWQPVVQTLHGTAATTHRMTLSLLDKLEDISKVHEAELEHMRSQDEMDKKKQEITLEVKETFFKYKKAILLMNIAKSKIDFQSKQVEILEVKCELGEAQSSDVIEEMIRLAEEEFSYVQAISDYFTAIAALNKAVGLDDYFKA